MSHSRQLAVIMFTDIVGYTALMGEDDARAFHILELNRKVHERLVTEYGGRILKEIGDGTLVSFDSVSSSVKCAIQMIRESKGTGEYHLSIGVHLGEVRFSNNDVFGDGVNIASRIEALAKADSVLISEKLWDEIRNHKDISAVELGTFQLKNDSKERKIFAVSNDGLTIPDLKGERAPSNGKMQQPSRNFLIGLPVVFILVAGLWYFLSYDKATSPDANVEKVIAVLPFDNLSAEEDNFFTAGVHEDVMNNLSGISGIKVIARSSVMKYADYDGDLKELGERLGANYFMEGSVRRFKDSIRFTTKLIEASSNQTEWSENYDRRLDNIFEVQSDLSLQVAERLKSSISDSDRKVIESSPTDDVIAYDKFLRARGIYLKPRINYEDLVYATGHLDDALVRDPNFVDAWALLSRTWSERHSRLSDLEDRAEELKIAADNSLEALTKAEELDPDSENVFLAKGYYEYHVQGDEVATVRAFDKALESNPDNSDILQAQASLFMWMGEIDRLIENMERAFAVDKENPRVAFNLTFAYEFKGYYDKMVPHLERLYELYPENEDYRIEAKYYQFLHDGTLDSYKEYEDAVLNSDAENVFHERNVFNKKLPVAMFNNSFEDYSEAWRTRNDGHIRGHGEWKCPMVVNDNVNHVRMLMRYGDDEEGIGLLQEVRKVSRKPVNEYTFCMFNPEVYEPKIKFILGDTTDARRLFADTKAEVFEVKSFPRGQVERAVLLQTADLVAPDQVYSLYRKVTEHPLSFVHMENICADPWTYPNLIKDPKFIAEVREDGRFVQFLEQSGFL